MAIWGELIIPKGLREYLEKKSMMEILDVDRRETNHSRFLGWLFEKREATEKLLVLLHNRGEKQNKKVPVINGIDHVSVKLEESVQSEGIKGRADIVITLYLKIGEKRYIVIENKIRSKEHNAGKSEVPQTELYYDFYENVHGAGMTLYVFLTPLATSELDKIKPQNNYIQINYQDIVDEIISPLSNDKKFKDTQNKVNDYLKALGINYFQEDIMAVEPKLEDYVKGLWDNNQAFFLGLLHWNDNSDEDKKDILRLWNKYNDLLGVCMKALFYCAGENKDIETLYYRLFPAYRDYTKYYVGDINDLFSKRKKKDLLDKNGLIYKIIESYSDNVSSSIVDLHEAFPATLRKKTSIPVVLTSQKSKRYKQVAKYNLYVHQSAWDGTTLMRHVIKHVSKVFPEFGAITEIPDFIGKDLMK